MPQIRRLAAIMFTDIVGYTALMANDEWKSIFHSQHKSWSAVYKFDKSKQRKIGCIWNLELLNKYKKMKAKSIKRKNTEEIKTALAESITVGWHVQPGWKWKSTKH